MRLFIAEMPSLAKAIVDSLGGGSRKDGLNKRLYYQSSTSAWRVEKGYRAGREKEGSALLGM